MFKNYKFRLCLHPIIKLKSIHLILLNLDKIFINDFSLFKNDPLSTFHTINRFRPSRPFLIIIIINDIFINIKINYKLLKIIII